MATGPYTNAASMARDVGFQGVVTAALLAKARTVFATNIATPGTDPPYSVELARRVLLDPNGWLESASWATATDTTLATAGLSAYTEAQVVAAVGTVWPFLARL